MQNSQMPVEIERKFRLDGFDLSGVKLPWGFEEILQTYLRPTGKCPERRVRSISGRGTTKFEYTEKYPESDPRRRGELKDEVNFEGYRILLSQADPKCLEIRKCRYTFEYEGRTWSVDEYLDIQGLFIAEIELRHEDEDLQIPPFLGRYVEVTDDPDYRNRRIAELLRLGKAASLVRERP